MAGRLEEQLAQGLIPGRDDSGARLSWADFRLRYEAEWLAPLSKGSKNGWRAAANHYEAEMKPKWLYDANPSKVSIFRGKLEDKELSQVSINSYLAALLAGFGWAASLDLIEPIRLPRKRRTRNPVATMRARVITAEEFDRMLEAAPKVCTWHRELVFFMRGLWLSGLRISELNRLRWERGAPAHVDVNTVPKMIVFLGGQKNGKDSFLPAPPQFWNLIDVPVVPGRWLTGHVFPVRSKYGGGQMTTANIGRRISECGKLAGVKTTDKEFASAHDLRSAYLTRLAAVATQSQVQTLARHADPKTTSQFYLRHEASALAEALGW